MRSSVRFAHANVNSIRDHFTDVKNLLYNKNIDIFALNETWLTPDIPDHWFNIDFFHFVRNDRNLKATNKNKSRLARRRRRLYMQGGGVLIYVRSGILFKVLAKLQLTHVNETEFVILELTLENGQRILVAAVYRRPKGLVLNSFFNLLYKYYHLYSNVILLGDLNSDLLGTDFYSESLKNLINDYGLYNVPFGATHHATSAGTWLDITLVDSADKLLSFEKYTVPFICNHHYLIIDYKLEPFIFNKRSVCTRDFRKFDSDSFRCQLKSQIELSSFSTYTHFAKIFDKLVTAQLIEFLEKNNLLSTLQSGFRKHYSTQSALVKITDDIRSGIDKGMVTILLLFDFRYSQALHFITCYEREKLFRQVY